MMTSPELELTLKFSSIEPIDCTFGLTPVLIIISADIHMCHVFLPVVN